MNAIVAICGTIVTIGTIIGNVIVYRKNVQTHNLVNSMSGRLLDVTASGSHAEGELGGRKAVEK